MTSDVPGAASVAADSPRRLGPCFDDDVVLLTGFPGGRAQALLSLLLEREPGIAVWLVVPPSELETAARLLAGAEQPVDRLRLIPGEPCAIDLGLSRQVYAELTSRVDRWFSLYFTSDFRASRELSFRVNLGAAREVVELCKVAERMAHVCFLSSSTVFGGHRGTVNEEELAVGQTFRAPAGEALALAEALLRRSLSDVPVSVARTPQVLGTRVPGGAPLAPQATGLYRLLGLVAAASSETALPLPPGANRPVQALPADFVAEALYAVSALGTRGHTYHFADADPPALADVLMRAAEHFGRRFEVGGGARALGRLLLRSPGFWLAQQSSRALAEWAEEADLSTRGGDRLLQRAGLRAPHLLDYLPSVLEQTERLVREQRLETADAARPFEVVG